MTDEQPKDELDKEITTEVFVTLSKSIEGLSVAAAYQHLGAALGLIALSLEKQNGIDRNQTFKMIQRNGHAVIKQMEQKGMKQ